MLGTGVQDVVGDALRSTFKLRPNGGSSHHPEAPTLALAFGSHPHPHPLSPASTSSSPMPRTSKKSILPTAAALGAAAAVFVDSNNSNPTPIPTMSTPSSSTTTTTNTPANTTSLLNMSATSSTGIYQQSVQLRSRLQRLPAFAPFFEFSHSGPRASRDVVQQMWETFSLGKPLCLLFNLQQVPDNVKIQEFADGILDPDPLRKERQRAIALFIMGVNALKATGEWEKDAPLFSISELVGEAMDTNGFVKVVATVLYLLNKLPPHVWSRDVNASALPSYSSVASLTSREDIERSNLVRELIETERKYCQDLEVMLSYAEYLGNNNIVSADTIHRLFPALKKLADFQRKLLIQMEGTAEHDLDEQNWGACFVKHEPEFAIYDAYIANYSQALDLAIAEQPTLKAASSIIDPLQLPAFLIKPVQRLCRYPMLLGSMLKLLSPQHPLHPSLVEGVAAVKRIADAANRALREKENEETWQHCLARIQDWKGLNLESVGPLLLDDVFGVTGDRKGQAEYHVFLFNRMLLLCRPKEWSTEQDNSGFKRSASSSSLTFPSNAPPTPKTASLLATGVITSRKAKTPFSIKGCLYIRNILEMVPEMTGPHALHIKYQDRIENTKWTIHCRNEEQLSLWHTELKRLLDLWKIEEADLRRSAKASLRSMKEQVVVNSSMESLDNMRSARRPVHPYHYTFETAPTRTRARNGSVDNGPKPVGRSEYAGGGGRTRSSSVSSFASEVYESPVSINKRLSDNEQLGSSYEPASSMRRGVVSGGSYQSRVSDQRADESADASDADPQISQAERYRSLTRDSPTHTRSSSQASHVSTRSNVSLPMSTATTVMFSARSKVQALPPQLPPPTGPQPPRPDSIDTQSPSKLVKPRAKTHSRQSSRGSNEGGSGFRYEKDGNACASLRQRVGDRVPAPLVPVQAPPTIPSTGQTPQSTLPELPTMDTMRPMSHRKSSTPIKGPRERGTTVGGERATPTTGYLEVSHPPYPSHTRSRSHSNPGIPPPPGANRDSGYRPAYEAQNRPQPRQRCESSSTSDSQSIFTSSEGRDQDGSPLTPLSFGEENKYSPTKSSQFGQAETINYLSVDFSFGSSGRSSAPISQLDISFGLDAPIEGRRGYGTGKTPKTAYYDPRDKEVSLGNISNDSSCFSARQEGQVTGRGPRSSAGLTSSVNGSDEQIILVRLHHEKSKFLIKLSHNMTREVFVDKIRKKIRLCGGSAPVIPLERLHPSMFMREENVSYLNENNQFVKLQNDYDFANAWKSVSCSRKDPEDEGILILAVGPTDHLDYNHSFP